MSESSFWFGCTVAGLALICGVGVGLVIADDSDDLDKESYRQGFAAGWCSQEHPEEVSPDPGQAWVDCVDGVVVASRSLEGDT